jgi:hypothetical protein
MIYEPLVCLAQTIHLSCTDTNTISKWKEEIFHMNHVTQEFYRVRPKWFLIPWYVRHKPCTYLASRLALSPNEPSFHLSVVTSEDHQVRPKQFISRWYVWCKLCTYLAMTLRLSPNGKKWDFTCPSHLGGPSSTSKMISKPMVRSMQTIHLSCVKISTILERTKTSFGLSLITQWYHQVRPKCFLSLWYV